MLVVVISGRDVGVDGQQGAHGVFHHHVAYQDVVQGGLEVVSLQLV